MAPSAGTGPRRSPPPALRPLRHSGAAGPRPWARLTSHRHSIRQLPREEFPSAAQLRMSMKGCPALGRDYRSRSYSAKNTVPLGNSRQGCSKRVFS